MLTSNGKQVKAKPHSEPNQREANTTIASGIGVGVLGIVSAAIGGAVCPVCVVAAPLLVGIGVLRRARTRKA